MTLQLIISTVIAASALLISVATLVLALKKAGREEVADDKRELRLEMDNLRAELKACLAECAECHASRLRDTATLEQLTRERVMMLERIAFRTSPP